jgi:phospholipid-binding lipoprotein MlaA
VNPSARQIGRRLVRRFLLAMMVPVMLGCATVASSQAGPGNPRDPWENWNRNVFAFNEVLDDYVLAPVAKGYEKITPRLFRQGVKNFFNNFADAWSAVNNTLQGKLERAFTDVVRVGTNTVFGIGGVFDIATEAGIEPTFEDFGQTLGHWGLPPGPYVVWPLFGPSNVRESFALPLDRGVSVSLAVRDENAQWGLGALQIINLRAELLGASRFLDDAGLDKYSFVRDAYLQRRRSLVFDGDPPEEPPPPEPVEPAATEPSSKKQ